VTIVRVNETTRMAQSANRATGKEGDVSSHNKTGYLESSAMLLETRANFAPNEAIGRLFGRRILGR
jgi:hypothetical protein